MSAVLKQKRPSGEPDSASRKNPLTRTHGWRLSTLGELAEYINGRGFKESEWRTEGLPIIRIQNLNKPEAPFNYAEGDFGERVRVRDGDLLVAWAASLGAYIWQRGDAWLNQHIFKVVVNEQLVDKKYLYYGIKESLGELYAKTHGSGMVHITKGELLSHSIGLPPLAEQRRIVAELETQLTRLNASVTALKRVQANLKRYRASVLKAACEGRLVPTEAELASREGHEYESGAEFLARLLSANPPKLRRRDNAEAPDSSLLPPLPDGWTWTTLPKLGELNRGKSKHRPRDDERLYGGPYPFIQTGDIRKSVGTVREYSQTYSEFGLEQSRLWPAGTLCITIAANIAETGVLTFPSCFPDSVVGFVHDGARETTRWVDLFLRTAKEKLERFAPATAQKNINLDVLSKVAVPLPPLAEQLRIVAEVERRLSVIEELEATVAANLKRAERLRQSVLATAFAA